MIKSALSQFNSVAQGEPILIEEVTDQAEIERCRAQHERSQRNTEWLEAHWGDLLPQARGKFLAVAGQEAFIADTPHDAWNWAGTVHPDDDGAFVRYVSSHRGPLYCVQSEDISTAF